MLGRQSGAYEPLSLQDLLICVCEFAESHVSMNFDYGRAYDHARSPFLSTAQKL